MKFITLTVNPCVDLSYYPEKSLVLGALNRVTQSIKTPGGKGINVTRALISLGERDENNVALYFAGHPERDEISSVFHRLCSGIDFASFSPILYADPDKRMRTCIKIFSPEGEITEINEAGSPISEDDLIRLIGALTDLIALGEPTVLILCGSIPQDVEIPVYNLVINLMKSCGVTCVLDSSGEPLKQGLKASPDLIKPNLEELSALAGRALEDGIEAVEFCKELFHRYDCEVLLTNGGKGAYFIGREGVFQSVPKGDVHSLSTGSVGCGDLFLASFVHSYYALSKGAQSSLESAGARASYMAFSNAKEGGVAIPDFKSGDICLADYVTVYRLE